MPRAVVKWVFEVKWTMKRFNCPIDDKSFSLVVRGRVEADPKIEF